MDSTIIKVINTMIQNPDKIANIFQATSGIEEFFFVYNMKHAWSILKSSIKDDYFLYYYKDYPTVKELVDDKSRSYSSIVYSASDFKSKEASETFKDLFLLIKGKTYGMDEVFNDILNS